MKNSEKSRHTAVVIMMGYGAEEKRHRQGDFGFRSSNLLEIKGSSHRYFIRY
jgi:hypothetical protein